MPNLWGLPPVLLIVFAVGGLLLIGLKLFRPNPRSLYEWHLRVGVGFAWLGATLDLLRNVMRLFLQPQSAGLVILFYVAAPLSMAYVAIAWWLLWRKKVRSARGHDIGR